MKPKRIFTAVIAIILVVLIVLPLVLTGISASAASSQEELDALKAEAEQIKEEKEAVNNRIAEIEQEQEATYEKKIILDQQIELTEDEITNSNAQIQAYTVIIADMQAGIDEATLAEQAQFDLFGRRMRLIEEGGTSSYWAILFDATSFLDLLDRADYVNELMASDQKVVDDLLIMRSDLDQDREELEEKKAEQKEIKDDLVLQEQELELQRTEADELMVSLMEEKEGLEEYYRQMEAQELIVAEEIDAMMEKIAEEERQAALNGTTTGYINGTGILAWPTPSTTWVTSPFGYRMHPILGYQKFHAGIDIGAGYGAEIIAADDGTVITAGNNPGGYGNYVVISHGGGMTTLYGHMSSISVSYGQNVSKGQVIGYVGSTGLSNGPHLHYEVRVNGQYTDPLSYY